MQSPVQAPNRKFFVSIFAKIRGARKLWGRRHIYGLLSEATILTQTFTLDKV